MQALYQWDLSSNSPTEIETSTRAGKNFFQLDADYFSLLFQGVTAHKRNLDAEIAAVSNQDFATLDTIVKNILRLGAYELTHCEDVSSRIIISEGVKLSEKFASEQAHSYVNGVLDKLSKKLREEDLAAKKKPLDEFTAIDLLRQEINRDSLLRYGSLVGDDCAVFPSSSYSALSVDTYVAEVHFPAAAPPSLIGYRTLCAAASDLAAMGAEPRLFLCALSLPSDKWREEYLRPLAAGMRLASLRCGLELAGGNMTAAPILSLHFTVIGVVSQPLKRSGSQMEDLIFVSGTLGDAAAGLRYANEDPGNLTIAEASLRAAYFCSLPRLKFGQGLVGLAHSCIDISDGLSGDIHHLLEPQGLGARISLSSLPLSAALRSCFPFEEACRLALGASDDYELLFTVPPKHRKKVEDLASELAVPIAVIGQVTDDGLCLDENGETLPPEGYRHRASSA